MHARIGDERRADYIPGQRIFDHGVHLIVQIGNDGRRSILDDCDGIMLGEYREALAVDLHIHIGILLWIDYPVHHKHAIGNEALAVVEHRHDSKSQLTHNRSMVHHRLALIHLHGSSGIVAKVGDVDRHAILHSHHVAIARHHLAYLVDVPHEAIHADMQHRLVVRQDHAVGILTHQLFLLLRRELDDGTSHIDVREERTFTLHLHTSDSKSVKVAELRSDVVIWHDLPRLHVLEVAHVRTSEIGRCTARRVGERAIDREFHVGARVHLGSRLDSILEAKLALLVADDSRGREIGSREPVGLLEAIVILVLVLGLAVAKVREYATAYIAHLQSAPLSLLKMHPCRAALAVVAYGDRGNGTKGNGVPELTAHNINAVESKFRHLEE